MANYGIGSWIDDRYRVDAELGSGGMGSVKLAFDPELNRKVAIKLLHMFSTESQVLQRFEREAKALGKLTHENIVRVYRFGMLEGNIPYLVMEYVEGLSLRDLLKSRKNLDCDEAMGIAMQICEALSVAHENQIIHRDLKPENVIVCDNGSLVKVLDFGLCRFNEKEDGCSPETITEFGTILGTTHYMSPEMCMGGKCEATTDIYSFGCMLFEMITGDVPFTSDYAADIFFMHVSKPFPRISELSPDSKLPGQVQDLILKCTEKNQENRYQSFAELQTHLSEIAALKSKARFISSSRANVLKSKTAIPNPVGILVGTLIVVFLAASFFFGTDAGNGMLAVQVQGLLSPNSAINILSDSVAKLLKENRASAAKSIVETTLSSSKFKVWPDEKQRKLLSEYINVYRSAGDEESAFPLSLRLLGELLDLLRKSNDARAKLQDPDAELMLTSLSKQLLDMKKTSKQWRSIYVTFERHNPFKNKIVHTSHAWLTVLKAEAYLHEENYLLDEQLHGLVSACVSAAENLQLEASAESRSRCLHYYDEALRVCRKHGFLEQEAQERIFLGTYFLRIGDVKRAKEELQFVLGLCEKIPLSPSYSHFRDALISGCAAGSYEKYKQYLRETHENRPEPEFRFLPAQQESGL